MVSERESQGRHLDTGGGFTRKHDRRARTANSLCILDRQRCLPKTLRDHVRSASALSALKKSLVANLSAKRQLSVAKLSAKRIFSLAKRDFLVANGRMAADFSSPDCAQYFEKVRAHSVSIPTGVRPFPIVGERTLTPKLVQAWLRFDSASGRYESFCP